MNLKQSETRLYDIKVEVVQTKEKKIRVPDSIEDSIELRNWILEFVKSNFTEDDFEEFDNYLDEDSIRVRNIDHAAKFQEPTTEVLIPKCDPLKFIKYINSDDGVECEYDSDYIFQDEEELNKIK